MLLHFTVSDKRRKHPLSNTKIKEKRSFLNFARLNAIPFLCVTWSVSTKANYLEKVKNITSCKGYIWQLKKNNNWVTILVNYLDAVPIMMIIAPLILIMNLKGFACITMKYIRGRTIKRWMPSPQITVSVYMPRRRNDSRILSTAAILAAIRLHIPIGDILKLKWLTLDYLELSIKSSFIAT